MAEQHFLKTAGVYFNAIWRGDKNFEVRKNDRDFQTGDTVVLEDLGVPQPGITVFCGPIRSIEARISYVLHGGQFGISPDYCVLALSEIKRNG